MITAVLALFTLLLVVVTLLPLWRNPIWWVRGWDFPRLQLAAIAIVLLVAQFWWLDLAVPVHWAMIAVTLACLAYQAWWIIPYTRPFPDEVPLADPDADAPRVRILTANVLQTNRRADRLLATVHRHRPDILVTLETDDWWEQHLETLADDYPYSVKCPLDNLYGMHLYSRLPLSQSKLEFLVEKDAPSIHTLVELAPDLHIRAHFLHPAPPSPSENDSSSERDAELVMVARSVAKCDGPIIVAGDLNDVAWSETTRLFRKLSGLLDPRVGRGMFNTFHADYPFARWPLDHLFHSRHFRLGEIRRLDHIGSDHFPLLTELVYTGRPGELDNGLAPDEDDLEHAETRVREQAVDARSVPDPDPARPTAP